MHCILKKEFNKPILFSSWSWFLDPQCTQFAYQIIKHGGNRISSHSGSSSFDPYSRSSWRHKLTNFGGFASGELRSTADRLFLCCVEQDGMRGVETGVRPVPPSINDSKLNGMPLVGVVIGIPATSKDGFMKDGVSTVLNASVSGLSFGSLKIDREFGRLLLSKPTGSEFGLFGLAAVFTDSHFVSSTAATAAAAAAIAAATMWSS